MKVKLFLVFSIFSFVLELFGNLVLCEANSYMFSLKNVEGMFSNMNTKLSRYLTSSEMDGDSMLVYGNSSYLKYYYTNIYLGTPPQKQSVIIDTGSALTAVPCKPYCTNCGKHLYSYYNMAQSASSEMLECSNKNCKHMCDTDKKCSYSMSYGEGSSLSGFMIQDNITLSDAFRQIPSTKVPIGCTTRENKLFFTQEVDGIMGLGPSDDTLIDSLVSAGVIQLPMFSICLAQNEGYFSLGGVNTTNHKESISYIPYYSTDFYKVKLQDITLNDDDISISDSEYYTIIDSGTTISYLPSGLFSQIQRSVNIFCSQNGKCLGDMYTSSIGMCFKVNNSVNMTEFVESLPEFTFIFESKVKYLWKPDNYLFNNTQQNGNVPSFCIGMASWNSNEILLGTTWMHNHDIIFDILNKRIGFASSDCTSLSGANNKENNEQENNIPISPTNKTNSTDVIPTNKTDSNDVMPTNKTDFTDVLPTNKTDSNDVLPTNKTDFTDAFPTNKTNSTDVLPTNKTDSNDVLPSNKTDSNDVMPTNKTDSNDVMPTNKTESIDDMPTNSTDSKDFLPTNIPKTSDKDFYTTILILSIVGVLLFVVLLIVIFRIRRARKFFWTKLNNEEASGENKNASNTNNKIEENLDKNINTVKSKSEFSEENL